MATASHPVSKDDLIGALLPIADDHLILGHRLSEWCGHAPMLEEELSLANIALDLLGQSVALYAHVGEIEGEGRTEDDFAFLRRERDYRNLLLVERPNQDFAYTLVRQFFFSAYMNPFWDAAMKSEHDLVRGVAGKAVKETSYHLRHSAEWVIRMGDGTEESANRLKLAVDELYPYTPELFETWDALDACVSANVLPDPKVVEPKWKATMEQVFREAFIKVPEPAFAKTGGRQGIHAEAFGHLLAELQFMQRAYPGQKW